MQKNAKNNETPKIETFLFGETPIRVIIGENSEPWFVASDLAKALDLQNLQMSVKGSKARNYEDGIDERYVSNAYIPHPQSKSKTLNVMVVLEPGVYQLIFKSRKEEAKIFQAWIFEEVLPAIRKTGKYEMPKQAEEHFDEEENALTLEGAALKLNYEVAVATRFIKVINDLLDDRLHSFKNFELREIMAQLKAGQQNMEKRLMGYIEDIINVIGKEKLNKDVPTPIVSYVYLMKRLDAPTLVDGLIMAKVGKSNNPDIRKFELEAGGAELSVIGRIGFPNEELAYVWEQTIKKTFEPHHYKREWYLLGEEEVNFFLGVGRLISILYGL
jgi:prophage antirepressor-like protein